MEAVSGKLERVAERGDVLVNSTGTGTLGRVGRWLQGRAVRVDGHVTVVKPATDRCPASILGYALLAAQDEVAALAEGSTGQTELSPGRLASFQVVVPSAEARDRIAETLEYCDELGAGLQRETALLTVLRDTLLPKLISGELHIRATEAPVEDVP